MILYMYIAPGQRQIPPRGQSFDVNRNVLSLHSFVASLKRIASTSDFIHDLINVYSRRSGADNPWGQNFDVNRNLLSLRSFATSFKKENFEV